MATEDAARLTLTLLDADSVHVALNTFKSGVIPDVAPARVVAVIDASGSMEDVRMLFFYKKRGGGFNIFQEANSPSPLTNAQDFTHVKGVLGQLLNQCCAPADHGGDGFDDTDVKPVAEFEIAVLNHKPQVRRFADIILPFPPLVLLMRMRAYLCARQFIVSFNSFCFFFFFFFFIYF